jgi:hypothetical protein
MASSELSLSPIAALTPLKILIVAEKEETLTTESGKSYVTAIQRAFQGGITNSPDGTETYYAVGEELGVEIQMVFWPDKESPPTRGHWLRDVGEISKMMQTCGHLFVVVFLKDWPDLNSGSPPIDRDFGKWLNGVSELALDENNADRIGLLPIALDPESEGAQLDQFNEFQRMPIADLGEYALRAGYLGLLALQRAWSLLSDDPDGRMKLFISHAKKDGAPIALALKSQIESLRWLQRFYDACDILPGTQWRRVLRDGVRTSVVAILRTDIYEQRPWCVQEIQWAEEFGCPAVVVDLRSAATMPREVLPVAGMVTVRISDGNLVRILNAALREAMRVQLFRHTVEMLQQSNVMAAEGTVVVPRPSISTLGLICEGIKTPPDKIRWVVVPEPFRENHRAAAERLVRAYFPKAVLGTPRDFVTSLTMR